ncbi:MAG: hypothetical protein FJW19_06695 [Actinobacteria bacterium]|nr:hypothetical protein [Actinomycetota bacterium]
MGSGEAASINKKSVAHTRARARYAEFAWAARVLANRAHRHGLKPPGFRTPPRIVGVDRSLRRIRDGVVVSVALRDRPFLAVLSDMVEGVVAANRLVGREAETARTVLWSGVESLMIADEARTRVA